MPYHPGTDSESAGKVHSTHDLALPPDPDVSAGARKAIEASLRASLDREVKAEGERAAAFAGVGAQFRRELTTLFGADGYGAYRALIGEEKRRRAALLLPRGRMELSAAEQLRVRRQQQQRLAAFLKKAKVSAKKLAETDARVGKRLAKMTFQARAKTPAAISASKVPAHVLATMNDVDLDPMPPFNPPGFWEVHHAEGAFTVSGFQWGFNKQTGTIGNVAQLQINDADNSDTGSETIRSLYGFWFTLPPATKTLKIWIQADLLTGRFFQNMAPEWYGTSHAAFRIQNALFSEVIGVLDGKSYQDRTAWRTWAKGGQLSPKKLDGTWDSGTLSESGWYVMEHSVLPTPVPGNKVLIWVGHESHHWMWVDDETGLGNANFLWRFNNIVFEPKP